VNTPGRLTGKTVLVTGGGTGIGAAIAQLFLEEGARVLVCGRRSQVLEARVAAWRAHGLDAHAVTGDVATDAASIVAATVETLGGIDILVNNAALSSGVPVEEMDRAAWRRVLAVNLDAAFDLVAAALPWLTAARGAILHISSISAVAGELDDVAYAASKAGLEGFSRKLALELAPQGVRSNVIRPGLIVTEAFDAMPQDFFDSQLPLIPLRRLGRPEDIAEAALFLCSPAASFITGAILTVDGGESAQ
jgi:NAD(P)-dependent dehydrogenase (short-subunit alcohol dehydrogenase family)